MWQMQFKWIFKLYVLDLTLVGLQEPDQQHVCPVIGRIEKCLSAAAYLLKKTEKAFGAFRQRITNVRDF